MGFSLRRLPIPPRREIGGYSIAERAIVQQQFAPLAARRRRLGRIAIREIYVLVGCVIASMFGFLGASALTGSTASWLFPWILAPAGACVAALIVTTLLMPRPKCPGCANPVEKGYGPYCPECGSRALERAGIFPASTTSRCGACRKTLSVGRGGKPYMIRFCTFCGLKLDEEGY